MAKAAASARLVRGSESQNAYIFANGRYDARKYWTDRHHRFRKSFRGVGDMSRSEAENIEDYVGSVAAITDLLRSIRHAPLNKSVLDVGCGNGFWAGVFQAWRVASYTGIDITDALFDLLVRRYPEFRFDAGDLRELELQPGFGLIAMIDVSQHVTDDTELRAMLRRLRSLLAEDGVFIVTFWNQVREQEDFYEAFRPFSFYTTALEGMACTEPRPFRDKFVSAFYNPGRQLDVTPIRALPREEIVAITRQILAA